VGELNREAAVVGDRRFWIEVQGMKLMNDQEVSQRDVNDPSMNISGTDPRSQRVSGATVRAGEGDRTSPHRLAAPST
jgi:hypothetical protein